MPESPSRIIRRAADKLHADTKRAELHPVADLLAAVAKEMDDYGSVIETAEGVKIAPAHGFRYDVAPLWTTALAAARALLREAPRG